jgi:hypothetical protein
MALIGLRMMPTFPSPSLRFRTVGFPQYGSKAGFQSGPARSRKDRSTTHLGLHLTFVSSYAAALLLALRRGVVPVRRHRRASGLPALPQGPSLRSGLYCPGPSSLNRPHPPHSLTRRNFPALRVICTAFAVLAHRQPRPSASGSELSHTVPSQPVALVRLRRVHRLLAPSLRRWGSPSSGHASDSALSSLSTLIRFTWGPVFGASWFTRLVQPAELLASLADRTSFPAGLRRLLLPSFRSSRSPFSPSDITTVASGFLHRQDFHLLKRQLASLHHDSGPSWVAGPLTCDSFIHNTSPV